MSMKVRADTQDCRALSDIDDLGSIPAGVNALRSDHCFETVG